MDGAQGTLGSRPASDTELSLLLLRHKDVIPMTYVELINCVIVSHHLSYLLTAVGFLILIDVAQCSRIDTIGIFLSLIDNKLCCMASRLYRHN